MRKTIDRIRRGPVALALSLVAAVATPALAQMRPGPLVLKTHPLHDGAYWISGGPSNTGFIVGDKGVIVFDVQISVDAAKKVIAEIAKVTPKPVNEIVLSHADPDHVAGLPAFAPDVPIVSQENAKTIIQASIADATGGGPRLGPMYQALATHLPTHLVGEDEKTTVDGVRIELIHTAPAHTPADLVLYMPDARVVFAGDLLVNNFEYPVIHNGGSSLGWIESMQAILALDADTYVPGHGEVEAKPLLQARLAKTIARRDAVKAMVERNMTLAQVEQALPEKSIDPRFPSFTQVVYRELTQGYPTSQPPWIGLNVKP